MKWHFLEQILILLGRKQYSLPRLPYEVSARSASDHRWPGVGVRPTPQKSTPSLSPNSQLWGSCLVWCKYSHQGPLLCSITQNPKCRLWLGQQLYPSVWKMAWVFLQIHDGSQHAISLVNRFVLVPPTWHLYSRRRARHIPLSNLKSISHKKITAHKWGHLGPRMKKQIEFILAC